MHARRAIFELSHPLVDQPDQILHQIRRRRVDGVAGALGIDLAQAEAVRLRGALRQIHAFGDGDVLGEDFKLFLDRGAAGIDDVDQFLEVEQPERQLEVLRVDHVGARAETAAEFVVTVEQQDAHVRRRVHDGVEDHRDAARLADAGGAEHGKMLVEHVADGNTHGDGVVVMQFANVGAVGIARENEAQVVARDDAGGVADGGISRNAALEALAGDGVAGDFAHHVDPGDGALGQRDAAVVLRLHFRNHADQPALTGENSHEIADRGPHVRAALRNRNGDARFAAAHAENHSKRLRGHQRIAARRLHKFHCAKYPSELYAQQRWESL